MRELNADVPSRSQIRIVDAGGQVRFEREQTRLSSPKGLTWFGRRLSTEGVTSSGTWTMEYRYEDVLLRRVSFGMVVM